MMSRCAISSRGSSALNTAQPLAPDPEPVAVVLAPKEQTDEEDAFARHESRSAFQQYARPRVRALFCCSIALCQTPRLLGSRPGRRYLATRYLSRCDAELLLASWLDSSGLAALGYAVIWCLLAVC
jgi:hypothetical protein